MALPAGPPPAIEGLTLDAACKQRRIKQAAEMLLNMEHELYESLILMIRTAHDYPNSFRKFV